MMKIFSAAALVASTVATQIVYRTGTIKVDGVRDEENRTNRKDFKVDPDDWKMQFRWPKTPGEPKAYRCTATMVSPQVALTAAHCVRPNEVGVRTGSSRLKVKIAGQHRRVREIRVPECWNFGRMGPFNVDVAMLILNKPLDDAVEGVDYARVWDPVDEQNTNV